jgi:hypothetical protein
MSDARETPTALAAQTSPGPRLSPTLSPTPTAATEPLQLGAIKELLQRFAHARLDLSREKPASELRELYRFLCEQARQHAIDPESALELYRASAAKRRPRLVHP